ncbi:hypothetical protein Syun_019294 [Stephania yunnanensis]|uniref:Uncharacterized protein n=1 Tax=Stephania yunnanensis TaxID=152371 RepID=A0AAP0ITU5_9MAGN
MENLLLFLKIDHSVTFMKFEWQNVVIVYNKMHITPLHPLVLLEILRKLRTGVLHFCFVVLVV